MGMIEDILKALDRLPLWKRLGELPPEVDDLKRRVAELEQKLDPVKWPADVCKACGARALRLVKTVPDQSAKKIRQTWSCGECNEHEHRYV